jgi:hypothetical protein
MPIMLMSACEGCRCHTGDRIEDPDDKSRSEWTVDGKPAEAGSRQSRST